MIVNRRTKPRYNNNKDHSPLIMHPILVAFSANKKMEEELRQTERKIDREQTKMLHRIGREKTDLFDTFIRLNIRTPHPETRSTGTERILLNRLELDTREILPKSISLPLGRSLRSKLKHVTPMIDVEAGIVYCQIQGDGETRKKLEPDIRTNHLLNRTRTITRYLESVASGGDDTTDQDTRLWRMSRAKTFVAVEPEVDRTSGLVRASTSLGGARRANGGGTSISQAVERNRGCTIKKAMASCSFVQASTKRITEIETQRHALPPEIVHKLPNLVRSQGNIDKATRTLAKDGSKDFTDSSRTSESGNVKVDGVKRNTHLTNSFQTLVYFNLGCMRLKLERRPRPTTRQSDSRQSFLKGYIPPRGVANVPNTMGSNVRRHHSWNR